MDSNKSMPDRFRPQYHFLPWKGWMGDPNGTIFHDGRYHVFYQYNPEDIDYGNPNDKWDKVPWGSSIGKLPQGIAGLNWGNPHWGHAVSEDLGHWENWPIEIGHTAGGDDEGGCFSGCTIVNDGVPTIVYTSTTKQPASGIKTLRSQSIATSDDGLRTWKKHPANPVLACLPDTSGAMIAWHDPQVWKEDDTWYMALGCGFEGAGGTLLLYQSRDLLRWEYMHPLFVCTDMEEWGNRWLVPDLFPMGEKYVLLICACTPAGPSFTLYAVGDYVDHCFIPDVQGVLGPKPAPCAMATRTVLDARGRRIAFSQLGEECSEEAKRKAGYHGVLSLPWELKLAADLTLEVEAVSEVCSSGKPDWQFRRVRLSPGEHFRPEGLRGDLLEIKASIDVGRADRVSLKLRSSPGGEEETVVVFDPSEETISVDATRSTLDKVYGLGVYTAPLKLGDKEPLNLHVFLDKSVIEIFANRRACLFRRVYPSREDSLGVALLAQDGEATILSLEVWEKDPVPIINSSA